MAKNEEQARKIHKEVKKKFGDAKSFKKEIRKKIKDFDSEKFKKAVSDDNEKGVKKYRDAIVDLLGFDVYNDSPKEDEKQEKPKTERQIKAEEEKQEKIMITIENLKQGEKVPKALSYQVDMKKSNLGIQNRGDGWVVSIDDEENGLLLEAKMNQKDKDAFRGCREVIIAIIGR